MKKEISTTSETSNGIQSNVIHSFCDGQTYEIEYKYKGQVFKDVGTYQGFKVGYHYFRCDGMGDWMVLKPKDIISSKNCG